MAQRQEIKGHAQHKNEAGLEVKFKLCCLLAGFKHSELLFTFFCFSFYPFCEMGMKVSLFGVSHWLNKWILIRHSAKLWIAQEIVT